jgi:PASTA domain
MEIVVTVRCVDADGKIFRPEIIPEVYVLPTQGWTALSAISSGLKLNHTADGITWRGKLVPPPRGSAVSNYAGFRLVTAKLNGTAVNAAPTIDSTDGALSLDFGSVLVFQPTAGAMAKTASARIGVSLPVDQNMAAAVRQVLAEPTQTREESNPIPPPIENPKSLDDAIAKLRKTEAELSVMKNQAAEKRPTGSVLSALGNSVGEAANQIALQNHPFTLGPVTIKLMGSVSDGGNSIVMADSVSADSAHTMSEIAMLLDPSTTPVAAQIGNSVPNVRGLTQAAAIDALVRAGLKHRHSTALIKPRQKAEHGRAVEQIPASGTVTSPGTEVLVVYGFLEDAS